MAVLGYVPQFIEQQYVPTQDIGLLSNILGQKQQQYNQAAQMQAGALADIYGREVTSGFEPAAQERIKAFETKLQELTDKRGGDLGAAIGDITSTIGSMYKDPFWRTANKAVEQSKILQQQLAKNQQLRVLNDPRSLSYREDLSDEDLAYKVFDPTSVTNLINQQYAGLRDKVQETGLIEDPSGSGYLMSATTKGATKSEIERLKKDSSLRNQIASTLGISDYLEKDPELAGTVNSLIDRGIEDLYGGTKYDYKQPLKISTGGNGELFGGDSILHSSTVAVSKNINDYSTGVFKDQGDKLAQQEAEQLGIPGIKSIKDLENIINTTDKSKQEYRASKLLSEGYSPGTRYREFNISPNYEKAKTALENIKTAIGEESPGTGITGYDINKLKIYDADRLSEINKLTDNLAESIKTNLNYFELEDKEKDEIKGLKNLQVEKILPNHQKNRVASVVYLTGEDKKGNSVSKEIKLNPNALDMELNLVNYLSKVSGDVAPVLYYEYNRGNSKGLSGDKYLEDALKTTIDLSKEAKTLKDKQRVFNRYNNIINFISSVKGDSAPAFLEKFKSNIEEKYDF